MAASVTSKLALTLSIANTTVELHGCECRCDIRLSEALVCCRSSLQDHTTPMHLSQFLGKKC